jgi:hypothetical protein
MWGLSGFPKFRLFVTAVGSAPHAHQVPGRLGHRAFAPSRGFSQQ